MCRADVHPQAVKPLGSLLDAIACALAAHQGVDRSEVTIGPVDFGDAQGGHDV